MPEELVGTATGLEKSSTVDQEHVPLSRPPAVGTAVGVGVLASASPLRVAGACRLAEPTVPFSVARTAFYLGASGFSL